MNNFKTRLILLQRCRNASRLIIWKIIRKDPDLTKIFSMSPMQISNEFTIPIKRSYALCKDLRDKNLLASVLEDMKKFHVLTIFEKDYPSILKVIKDPPIVLYLIGNLDLLKHKPCLSVVGTREPSQSSWTLMEKVLFPLVKEGWLLVSGMAKGIDANAHRLAVKGKGNTIAVLGSGFHHIYPRQHTELFRQLAATQLVISEYAPSTPPKKYHFPERNRIISGLSFGTLVVEAKEKSGTMITVEQALDQGREVYAFPGSPLSDQSSGCNKLIQEGAKLVLKTHDLVEDWHDLERKWGRILSENEEN
ncbi:DNA-processing protein DprA [Sediminibacillus massiliensis]|uniref:DNA-processing protein DprA n=1 Tax=Sediminibacillus massiliensis TaxID=1926277 RepID=UPI000BAE011E|nr:DNA-processing protein DprA [Sediminibacillus massiliensis]